MNMPLPTDFADADGYIDWEDYDYALQLRKSDIPDLFESWCPLSRPRVDETELSISDIIAQALAG